MRRFVPPFCPNEDCPYHLHTGGPETWPWQSRGLRTMARRPYVVRNFSCRHCGRWFRASVFGPDYWKKLSGLSARIYDHVHDGDALRQAARKLRCGATTVRWHVRLLARQSLLIHLEQLQRLVGRLREDVALDGLRTFAGSQYEPLDVNTAILTASGFVVALNAAGLRRSGSMRPDQRVRRELRDERLGRPDPRGRERSVHTMLAGLLELTPHLNLRTDEEPDYRKAAAPFGDRITHMTVNSKERRDALNLLWKVNCLHGWARHALRALVRETIAFAKTSAGLLDRSWIFLAARNNTKGIRERDAEGRATTPAMLLGLEKAPRRGRALFSRRRFPRRVGLPKVLEDAYRGTWRARPRENVRPYVHRFVS